MSKRLWQPHPRSTNNQGATGLNTFRYSKRGVDEKTFTTQLTELIRGVLPGFQYDRKAHVTNQYYLEFVRRTDSGYQMIEVQRFYRPLGFYGAFGVARYRLPFADLVPGTNQAIPGYRFDVSDIAPNHIGRWTYSSYRSPSTGRSRAALGTSGPSDF